MGELLMLLALIAAAAFIYTRLRKTKIGSFDEFMELKWLFPSRRREITYDDIRGKISKAGICTNLGKKAPWTNKTCKCTGYKYAKTKRGTPYCDCGCQMLGHKFKISLQIELTTSN